jgi:hypothetical protein
MEKICDASPDFRLGRFDYLEVSPLFTEMKNLTTHQNLLEVE